MMETRIKELLASRNKLPIEAGERIPAAVLLPLYQTRGQYHVVFIRRTETVTSHKGQISFPGGGREAEDADLRATALRESWEEIGLRPGDTEILGELDDELTMTSNYVVTPFVGVIPWPYEFVRNEREVDEILTAPLAVFADGNSRTDDKEILDGKTITSYSYRYGKYVIWGATARILYKFLGILQPTAAETGPAV